MKEKEISRRQFIQSSAGGIAALVVGSQLPWLTGNKAFAAVSSLNFTITDAIKEMATHNAVNTAECYFWVFKEARVAAEVPGPIIYAAQGDTVNISITNALDEPHAFFIPGMFDSGPIAPGGSVTTSFTVTGTGTFLYYDNLNEPVNRVMGLHGAFIAMPAAKAGTRWTPYANPTPQVQQLFDELGTADHWPGLAWEEGDPATLTPPFRQCVWLTHQASQSLFRDVGSLPAGVEMPAAEFIQRFTNDAFAPNSNDINLSSDIPQYFTINGQGGFFCHDNPVITPMGRVGEPFVVRVLNAGLMTHSMHLHCNHYYVISVDGVVQGDPEGNAADRATLLNPGIIWVDTFTLNPPGYNSSRYDLVIPFMRSPDVPNEKGIGRAGSGDAALLTINGHPTWPPIEEFDVYMPPLGTMGLSTVDGVTPVSLAQRESPLCFPMHDHSEPSQSTQGGNYNTALISGMYIIGDRNIELPRYHIEDLAAAPGGHPMMPLLPPQTFPMDMDFAMMLGLSQSPQILTMGCDEARRTGIQEACEQSDNEFQKEREEFPPLPVV